MDTTTPLIESTESLTPALDAAATEILEPLAKLITACPVVLDESGTNGEDEDLESFLDDFEGEELLDDFEGEELLVDEELLDDFEGKELLVDENLNVISTADAVTPMMHSTADSTRMRQGVELFGMMTDVDPSKDVTDEMANLSDDDKQRIQSLREMAEAENLTLSDSQLLAFLNRVRDLSTTAKKLTAPARTINAKEKEKRRAAAKAAKASRKKNRR